ncbi:MAG TPA: hypothetical protein VMM78_17785 [Thermomicrobiales bacterium]|nr:hypothetical protein [Thermomicrobiales bacterium]
MSSLNPNVTIASNGAAVSGAAVTVRFTYPNRSTHTMTATTNASGTATFRRTAIYKGIYTVTDVSLSKRGGAYNPASNTVTGKSLTI